MVGKVLTLTVNVFVPTDDEAPVSREALEAYGSEVTEFVSAASLRLVRSHQGAAKVHTDVCQYAVNQDATVIPGEQTNLTS